MNLKNVYFGVEGMQACISVDILYTSVLKGWKKSPFLLIPHKSLLKTCQWHRNFLQRIAPCYLWSSKKHMKQDNTFLYIGDFI